MFKNFLNIALRNLLKNKIFSFINILGLAIGIAASLLIIQYVSFELSYDNFLENRSSLYRIQQDRFNKGELSTQWAAGCSAVGQALSENFPEVEAFARLTSIGGVIIHKKPNGEKIQFREERMFMANSSFLPMFKYKVIKGGVDSLLLKEPYKAVINEKTARKYFQDEDPIGKTLSLNDRNDFEVVGVVEDYPENTHLKFDILFSFETYVDWQGEDTRTAWFWDGFYNYILLAPGTDYKQFEAKIPDYIEKTIGESLREYDSWVKFNLQPVQDIHLYSDYMMEAEVNGDGNTVYFLLIIAFTIILIAWVNYINLSTARSIDRAKEVGIRKVMGSQRPQLIRQFLLESSIINAIAIMLALVLLVMVTPFFSNLIGKNIPLSLFSNVEFWLVLSGLFIIGSFLAGIYPAFVLSSFQPVTTLKGKMSTSAKGVFLRKVLVIIQFAASVFLIAGTLTVMKQVDYMQNQDLGVDIDQTVVIKAPEVRDSTYSDRVESFKTEMLRFPKIENISVSTAVPGSKPGWNAGGIRKISDEPTNSNQYRVVGIDYNFVDAFQLSVISGRNFSRDFKTDEETVLFNESAIRLLGFQKPEEALNEKIYFWGDTFKIIGVIKDYHHESLKSNFDPLIFRLIPSSRNYYSLKLNPEQVGETLGTIEATYRDFFPGNPFEYFFLDEHFEKQYKADMQFGKIFGIFAGFAIFVACLGLFGLSSFMVVQRTKEIGVRKVLGASIISIINLLSKEFVRLIIVASVVALPLAWFTMNNWLEGFANKINLGWWVFLLPLGLILLIALITVSIQTVKAAISNPVDALRNE
ncbi:ABC transporter permease [Flexithrix dorotheae]|uniref:ABC transporter permease n=1 Tax=Flexithrix dorotheae TaxID=70993 RepID=UPI000367BE93|nr:ABC transporter permease [Flexithrix dorotheae]